jgi:hypothetical protein
LLCQHYTGFIAHTDPSATPKGPACPSRDSGWLVTFQPPFGLPVLLRSPYARMLPPLPRWDRWLLVSLASPTISAFPVPKPGRLPHYLFRGLLGFHCTLQPAGSRGHLRDPFHRGLQSIRYLHDCSDCYRLERKLPGGSVSHWVIAPFHGALRVRGFRENRGQVYARASQPGLIPRLARAPCDGHRTCRSHSN